MAIVKFERATDVRRYQAYQVDTDDLTSEQLTALTALCEGGDIDEESPEVLMQLEKITDTLVVCSEESAPADEANLNFIFIDEWEG